MNILGLCFGVWAANNSPPAAEPQRASRKRARRINPTHVVALAAFAFAAPAHALTVFEQGWQIANTKCQGGDAKECVLREQLGGKLKRMGCVFQEEGSWWKCPRTR